MEVKIGSRLKTDDIAATKQFIELHNTESCHAKGVILYGGADIRYFGPTITALPYASLFPPD